MKLRQTRFLYDYWARIKGERSAPDRSEVEPADISSVLGDTFILERSDEQKFPFRLAGSRLCSIFRRELKSRDYLGLWIGRDREAVGSILNAITEEMAAAVIGSQGFTERGDAVTLETVLLPLRRGGEDCNRILGAMAPAAMPYWLGAHPVMKQRVTALRLIWPDEINARMSDDLAQFTDDSQTDRGDEPPVLISSLFEENKSRRHGHLMVFDGGRDGD